MRQSTFGGRVDLFGYLRTKRSSHSKKPVYTRANLVPTKLTPLGIKRVVCLYYPTIPIHGYICDTDNILTSNSTRDDFRLNRFAQYARMLNAHINDRTKHLHQYYTARLTQYAKLNFPFPFDDAQFYFAIHARNIYMHIEIWSLCKNR